MMFQLVVMVHHNASHAAMATSRLFLRLPLFLSLPLSSLSNLLPSLFLLLSTYILSSFFLSFSTTAYRAFPLNNSILSHQIAPSYLSVSRLPSSDFQQLFHKVKNQHDRVKILARNHFIATTNFESP